MSPGARAVALVGLLVACAPFGGAESTAEPGPTTDAGPPPPSDAVAGDASLGPFTCPREVGWVCTTFDEAATLPPGWSVTTPVALSIVSGAGPTPPNQLRVVVPAQGGLNARLYHSDKRLAPPASMTSCGSRAARSRPSSTAHVQAA